MFHLSLEGPCFSRLRSHAIHISLAQDTLLFLMSATKSYTPCFYRKYFMNHGSISFTKRMLQFATYQLCCCFLFSMIHILSLISLMAFIRITQDANIHNSVVQTFWFLCANGKVTKSTCWHNEKMVLVHMLTKKPLGYKRFLTLPNLQMYLPLINFQCIYPLHCNVVKANGTICISSR